MSKKLLGIIIGCVLLFGLFLAWLVKESSKPLPGQSFKDEGRTHVSFGEKVKYATNPPTSGNHYPDWTRAGMFDKPQQDEYLVHSLEHGYVIISYNCEKQKDPKACVSQVKKTAQEIFDAKKQRKLIVTPRTNMDTFITLTAWTRMEKLDTMDKSKISVFIDAFRDHGPEATME